MNKEKALEVLRKLRVEAYVCVNQTKFRYGQALYNVTANHYPNFVKTVIGSKDDCYLDTMNVIGFESKFILWMMENYK